MLTVHMTSPKSATCVMHKPNSHNGGGYPKARRRKIPKAQDSDRGSTTKLKCIKVRSRTMPCTMIPTSESARVCNNSPRSVGLRIKKPKLLRSRVVIRLKYP